jgi:hypothetical protein
MSDDLHVGDRVYNPRFGRGEVIQSERIDTYRKVVIRFETGEEFTLRDPKALHLEKIGEAPRAASEPTAPSLEAPASAESAGARGEEVELDRETLRQMLVEALEEVCGPAEAAVAERWRGGTLILKPGKSDTLQKELPLEKFLQKIIRLRDQLRVLEQKINAHPGLTSEDKIAMQQYITRCYGTLTTFNLLFRDADDRFVGSSAGDD